MAEKRYELIEHTADVGIKVYGKDLKELFANAAFGMFEVIADLKNVQAKAPIVLELDAPDTEELLVSWLRELLYEYNSNEILFKDFKISQIDKGHIKAKAFGEKLDTKKHQLRNEVKAVTYSDLKIKETEEGLQAQIIFDI